MAEFFHCPLETTTTLLIGYTPTQNKKFEKKIMLIPSNIPLPELIFSSTHLCGFLVSHSFDNLTMLPAEVVQRMSLSLCGV